MDIERGFPGRGMGILAIWEISVFTPGLMVRLTLEEASISVGADPRWATTRGSDHQPTSLASIILLSESSAYQSPVESPSVRHSEVGSYSLGIAGEENHKPLSDSLASA